MLVVMVDIKCVEELVRTVNSVLVKALKRRDAILRIVQHQVVQTKLAFDNYSVIKIQYIPLVNTIMLLLKFTVV